MRKFLFLLFCICFGFVVKSQNLMVEGVAPNLYINHTVAPKENFYSIGRLYNQSPKTIAGFNSLVMERGLTIGQHLKVPLDNMNFEKGEVTNPGETLIPVTHIVKPGETIFKMGSNTDVSPDLIKKWNGVTDNISPGRALIVGHLRVKNDQANVNALKAAAQAPVTSSQIQPQQNIEQAPVAATVAEAEPVIEKPIRNTPRATPAQPKTEETTNVAAPPVVNTPVVQAAPAAQNAKSYGTIDLGSNTEGAFANNFPNLPNSGLKNLKGEAGTFKSTSGWQDKKYYVLINDITPGTIVKIAANDNKFVFAKVLGSMPEMKENNGLLLRISNSAASHLGIIDPKFPVQISYYQ